MRGSLCPQLNCPPHLLAASPEVPVVGDFVPSPLMSIAAPPAPTERHMTCGYASVGQLRNMQKVLACSLISHWFACMETSFPICCKNLLMWFGPKFANLGKTYTLRALLSSPHAMQVCTLLVWLEKNTLVFWSLTNTTENYLKRLLVEKLILG